MAGIIQSKWFLPFCTSRMKNLLFCTNKSHYLCNRRKQYIMKKIKIISERRKDAEAKARRMVAMAWKQKNGTLRYRTAAAKELCGQAIVELKQELFDGILLRLKEPNSNKSVAVQKRLLRRIVEKRMAQTIHHAMRHERGYISAKQISKYSNRCMEIFRDNCNCNINFKINRL